MEIIFWIICFVFVWFAIGRVEKFLKKEFGVEQLSWKAQVLALFGVIGAVDVTITVLGWLLKGLVFLIAL